MNALVAQSGGTSPVINASLQGVIDACFASDAIDKVYAGWHGIEGVLKEELIDMTLQDKDELSLLKYTPAAGAIGTCRYKLHQHVQEDLERILDVFVSHNIGYFFYIGGNDSMDTAAKVSVLAKEKGIDLIVTGIPKTIDNDVGDDAFQIIDHTPGYASAARYWATLIQNIDEENRAMCTSEPVSVFQAMGRTTGWLTAAARLGDIKREMPLQMYFAESKLSIEDLNENVNRQLEESGRCIVIVNEGFDVGDIGEHYDAFGHIEYGASEETAVQSVTNYLNKNGLVVPGKATGQLPGVIQRSCSIFASKIDIDEAYGVGHHAVGVALNDGTGYMATILRKKQSVYESYFDKVALELAANSQRFLPDHWISKNRVDVTDAFIDYALPLIQGGWPDIRMENGLQRFARIKPIFIEKKLPAYTLSA